MHCLFEYPGADTLSVVAPSFAPAAVLVPEKIDIDETRPAQSTGVDQCLDLAPLRGLAELVSDRQHAPIGLGGLDQTVAIRGTGRHWFF